MKKRALALLLVLLMAVQLLPTGALAAEESCATVYVTASIAGELPSSKDGELMAHVPVTVAGESPTVDDVLTQLHDAYYDGGAADGYKTTYNETLQSTQMTKLWGETDGVGAFYVNGSMPDSSVDTTSVSDGDVIDVIIYRSDWSDCYAYFNSSTYAVGTDVSFDLTLSYRYYDANWEVHTALLGGATIRVDGVTEPVTTDDSGVATLSFDAAGTYVVSAAGPDGTNITAPACVVTVVDPIEVAVSAQQGSVFLYPSQTVSVAYGTAQAYGFSNDAPEGTITALDALVAAHADAYGAAFTEATAGDYLTVSAGCPSELFANENSAYYSGFAINHAYPMDEESEGYVANTAPLCDGDVVEFFYYEDPYWGDYLTWFADAAGNAVDGGNVEVDETFTLYLTGFMYMAGYASPEPEAVYNSESGLTLYTVNADGSLGDSLGSVCAETGAVSLSFDTEGTYYLTAQGEMEDEWRIVMPWCKIVVGSAGSITDNEAQGITVDGLTLTPEFDGETDAYTLPDQAYDKSAISLKVGAEDEDTVTASNHGGALVAITPNDTSWKNVSLTAGQNEIAVTITPPIASGTLPKTYTVSVLRAVALEDLSVSDTDGIAVNLNETVSATTYVYTAKALVGASIVLEPIAGGDADNTEFTVNGAAIAQSYAITEGENTFIICAQSTDGQTDTDYTFTVTGVAAVGCDFTVAPDGTVLSLYDSNGNQVEPASGTSYPRLMPGDVYTYTAAQYGYVAAHGTITAGTDTAKNITLSAAPENSLTQLDATWSSFRNSDANMALTDVKTPRTAAEANEKWVTESSLNSGWYSPSPMLLVDDSVIVTSGATIYQINKETGATVNTGTMTSSDGVYGSAPPVYAEGMVIVPLLDGTVQAFDATTLTSLWVSESLGSQCTAPLTYADGCVYGSTGNTAPAQFFLPVGNG